MSEIISSEGAAEPVRRPKPQPFPQGIPLPHQGDTPRPSLYDESVPVVRDEAPEAPLVTGNAPERQPAAGVIVPQIVQTR